MHSEDKPDENKTYSCSSCDKILTTKWGLKIHKEICKKQREFNDQDDKDQGEPTVCLKDGNGDESNDESDEDEKDFFVPDRMEHIFLMTNETEDNELKEEPIVVDRILVNDTSVKLDPEICKEETRSVVKEEPNDEEEIDSCEVQSEFEVKENDFNDLFENDSSEDDCQSNKDLRDDSHDHVIDRERSVDSKLDDSVVSIKDELQIDEDETLSKTEDDEARRTCNKCQPKKLFPNDRSFRRHSKTVHLKQRFPCDKCDKTFSVKPSLERHIKGTHEQIFNFKCEEAGCKKSFYDKTGLRHHLNSDHNNGDKSDRTCKICFKVFKYQKYLKTHISSIHQTTPQFSCQICKQSFSFHRSMTRHMEIVHERKKEFKCTNDGCNIQFQSTYELNEHLKIHGANIETLTFDEWQTAAKDRTCGVCKRIFSCQRKLSEHKLLVHEKLGSSERITCDVCEKVLSSQKCLYTHKKIAHEGIRWAVKMQCRLCKEVFKSTYTKKKHWKQVHQNGKTILRKCQLCNSDFQLFEEFKAHIKSHVGYFMCIICGAHFSDDCELLVHVESHKFDDGEPKRFCCDICSHRLATKNHLEIHMRKHFSKSYYVCDVCGKSYKFIGPFLYHRKGHQNKLDFACRFCEKQFRVSRDRMLHERSHTGERPYKCNQCDKRFVVRKLLNKHLKTHELALGAV